MKAKILSTLSMILGVFGFSQTTEIYFKYDEAGNQRYRGTNINARQATQELAKAPIPPKQDDEVKKFWEGIKVYPVPVKDILTIEWTDENNELIDNVSLYEQPMCTFLPFQSQL